MADATSLLQQATVGVVIVPFQAGRHCLKVVPGFCLVCQRKTLQSSVWGWFLGGLKLRDFLSGNPRRVDGRSDGHCP